MDLTIAALVIVMKARGIEGDLVLTAIMGVLATISLSLLVWFFRGLGERDAVLKS